MSEECAKCGAINWSDPKYQPSLLLPRILPFDKDVIQNECLVYKCLTCGASKVTNTKDRE